MLHRIKTTVADHARPTRLDALAEGPQRIAQVSVPEETIVCIDPKVDLLPCKVVER